MPTKSEKELAGFIDKFAPETAADARAALTLMRMRLPGAIELVYDNYNALAIGFGATDRKSGIIFSIAVYPRWVSLFFARGVDLPDPEELLKGDGTSVRHIVLKPVEVFDNPGVQKLIDVAIERSPNKINSTKSGEVIIKLISAKQRPRRPSEKKILKNASLKKPKAAAKKK